MTRDFRRMQDELYFGTVTIADSADTSDALDIGSHTLCGVQVPAGMDSSSLSFLVSLDGVTFVPLRLYSGDDIMITLPDTDAAIYTLSPQDTSPARFIKVVGDSNESPAKDITIIAIKAAEND